MPKTQNLSQLDHFVLDVRAKFASLVSEREADISARTRFLVFGLLDQALGEVLLAIHGEAQIASTLLRSPVVQRAKTARPSRKLVRTAAQRAHLRRKLKEYWRKRKAAATIKMAAKLGLQPKKVLVEKAVEAATKRGKVLSSRKLAAVAAEA